MMQEETRIVRKKQGSGYTATAWLVALPGLLFLLVFEGIPAMISLVMSFKNYSPLEGIFASPMAQNGGLGNFQDYLSSPYIGRVVRNTLVQNVASIVLIFVVAFALVWCISHLPKRSMRIAALCLVAVPFFVPSVCLAGNVNMALSPLYGWVNQLRGQLGAGGPIDYLTKPEYYLPIYCFLQVANYAAVPVVIGVAVCEKFGGFRAWRVAAVLGVCAVASLAFLLTSDYEVNLLLYRPVTYEIADTIDTYTYRAGLVDSNYAIECASWVLKSIVQVLLCVGAYVLIEKLFCWAPAWKPLAQQNVKPRRGKAGSRALAWIGYVLLTLGILMILLPMLMWDFSAADLSAGFAPQMLRAVGNSVLYALRESLLVGVLAAMLAYPLLLRGTRPRWPSRLYGVLLAIFAAIAFNRVGDKVFYTMLDFLNPEWYIILIGVSPVIPALALSYCVRGKFGERMPDFKDYLKASLWPLVIIVLLQFVVTMGEFYTQMVYFRDQGQYGIGNYVRMITIQTSTSLGAIINPSSTELNSMRFVLLLSSIFPVLAGTAALILDRIKNKVSAFGARLG